jgi:two-component system copper resistance phosphate regulon response regulator CusR
MLWRIMKILLVEDDQGTVHFVRLGLEENGFVVDVASGGEAALQLARSRNYDLGVLDVMLPGLDGWSVLHQLRLAGKQWPVLFLTARDSMEDRVRGLELGADDYLVKPFAYAELLARIRNVLRRSRSRQQPSILQVGDLEIDLLRHRSSRDGVRLDLRPKEFALLSLLARCTGEDLSRTHIAEQVWDMNFDSDSKVVDVHIRRLRMTVDDPFPRKLIHTLRCAGYVLEIRAKRHRAERRVQPRESQRQRAASNRRLRRRARARSARPVGLGHGREKKWAFPGDRRLPAGKRSANSRTVAANDQENRAQGPITLEDARSTHPGPDSIQKRSG